MPHARVGRARGEVGQQDTAGAAGASVCVQGIASTSVIVGFCSFHSEMDPHVRDCVRSYTEDWAIVNRK